MMNDIPSVFTQRAWPWSHKDLPSGRGLKIGPVVYSWAAVIIWLISPLVGLIHPLLWPAVFVIYLIQWMQFDRAGRRATRSRQEKPVPVQTSSPQNTGVAGPGWYPDPTEPRLQRYWDGQHWTDQIAGSR